MLNRRSHRSGGHRRKRNKEQFGERKTTRQHDPWNPSELATIAHEMTHLPFRSLVQSLHQGKGARGGLSQRN